MKKLYSGIRVEVWKMNCGDGKFAGGYKVCNVEAYSCKAEVVLSLGQPFDNAYREAELLATIIDAEFVLKEGISEEIIRKSLTAEYS